MTGTGCSPRSKTANSPCRRRASLVRVYICITKPKKSILFSRTAAANKGRSTHTDTQTHINTNTRGYLHSRLRLAIRVCVPFGWTFLFWSRVEWWENTFGAGHRVKVFEFFFYVSIIAKMLYVAKEPAASWVSLCRHCRTFDRSNDTQHSHSHNHPSLSEQHGMAL